MDEFKVCITDKNSVNSPKLSLKRGVNKIILVNGATGDRPVENSYCSVVISEFATSFSEKVPSTFLTTNCADQSQTIIIGEADTKLDRKIEDVLKTMYKGETSHATIEYTNTTNANILVQFQIKLDNFSNGGFIFEWSADERIRLAQSHKERGVFLFNRNQHIDAFYRFSKALKLLILASNDGKINNQSEKLVGQLKTILYGNLASCQLKAKNYDDVIELCNKVLDKDSENIKAIYKRAIAETETNAWDHAERDLVKYLDHVSDANAQNKLNYVRKQLLKSHQNFVEICEKMFR